MRKYLLLLITIILLASLTLSACEKKPLKIGFIGDISTKNSQLAVDARNAVEYRISLLNKEGGINGREIILVSKDDQSDQNRALEMHQEFKKENISLVIGHMNSSMADPVLTSSSKELLFLSPTMSTTKLSGYDDYFLRTSPVNDRQADTFVDYAIEYEIDDLLIVYDMMNADYTKNVAERVITLYEEVGLSVNNSLAIDTRVDDINEVSERINAMEYSNILLLTQATDTAYIVQNIKKVSPDIGVFSVSWSMTSDFYQHGGKAVDGTIFVGTFYAKEYSKEYLEFEQGFKEAYGYAPSFVSLLAYDAIDALILALEKADSSNPDDVKEALLDIQTFVGLQETFDIDEYGDTNRQYLMYQLVETEFIPLRDLD